MATSEALIFQIQKFSTEFLKIAKTAGVKNPHWSGLTKRTKTDDMNTEVSDKSTTPSC